MKPLFIAPSILSANFSALAEDIEKVLDAGADMIHFDVMDNHYVPNLTMGPMFCAALRKAKIEAPLDVHLMITPVDGLIEPFAKAGATYITFHPDATTDVQKTIDLIKKNNCKVGLAVSPPMPIETIQPYISQLDLILVMSVNPGFGGQKFMPEVLPKIQTARAWIGAQSREIILSIDGGINTENVSEVIKTGANMIVAGSAIFGTSDYQKTIEIFRKKMQQGI